jgi:16S rRNA (guanine527-N7)-methyltransferase
MSRGPDALSPESFERGLADRESFFGLTVGAEALRKLARYLSELDLWRRRFNLTGRLSSTELVDHVLESALAAQLISEEERVVDIGSGSGLPGLVLATLRPKSDFLLVEPRKKKAAFLRHAARDLGLPRVKVFPGRIEDVGGQTFDVATGRALGGLAERAASEGLVESGGRLLAWTTEPERLAAAIASFRLERTVSIPGSERKAIAVFRKL